VDIDSGSDINLGNRGRRGMGCGDGIQTGEGFMVWWKIGLVVLYLVWVLFAWSICYVGGKADEQMERCMKSLKGGGEN
jgi:hypothetical protein